MKKLFKMRMLDWLVIAIVLSIMIFLLYPQQLPVSLYKLNLIAMAGYGGYWLDRSLFPYARPDRFCLYSAEDVNDDPDEALNFCIDTHIQNDLLFAVAQVRRALIVVGAMIAIGLGA